MHTVDDPIFEAVYEALNGDLDLIEKVLNAIADLDDASDKLNFARALITAANFNPAAEYRFQQDKDRELNAAKQFTKGIRDTRVTKWVLENLEPGMMIKVAGTRDGQGWRKVIQLEDRFGGTIVKCQKWSRRIDRTDGKLNPVWSEEPYITDHLPKKVVTVKIDGVWQNVNDLTKEMDNV